MKQLTRLTALLLTLVLLLGSVSAEALPAAAGTEEDILVGRLLAYYRDYQERAETDIRRTLDQLSLLDPARGQAWREIMDFWSYANTQMPIHYTPPEALPADDSLCIVVLGLKLNGNGTMKPELVDRLRAGLACAEAYPQALVAVTGGGTAANAPDKTEGGVMGQWMLAQGLDPQRLLVEDRAPDTVGNAKNTFAILTEQYPQVRNIVMVSSDYHIPRASVLFQTVFILDALEKGVEPLQVISNTASDSKGALNYESIALQAKGLASIAGVTIPGKQPLSVLKALLVDRVDGQLRGEAHYENGYRRDVSEKLQVTGTDPQTVTYEENGVVLTTELLPTENHKEVCSNTYLRELVKEASAIPTEQYSKDSVQVLREALAQAQAALDLGSQATLAQLDGAYTNLRQAMDGLVQLANLAYKMKVTANCNQKDAFKVNDGSMSTYWSSTNAQGNVAAKDAWFEVELDGIYQVEQIHVFLYPGINRWYKYKLQGSLDGTEWFDLAIHDTEEDSTANGVVHPVSALVSRIRLQGIETHVGGRPDINNLHVKEIQVYGCEASNLALGKPVTSSGTDTSAGSSSGSRDTQAVDGDRTTYWDGGTCSGKPWITVDLGDLYDLDRLNVITYWARNDSRYYYYDLYTSLDGQEFQLLHSKNSGTDKAVITGDNIPVAGTVYARYVKLVGTYDSKNPSFHLNELRVYGNQDFQAAVQAVAAQIAALAPITPDSRQAVTQARAAYEALDPVQKSLVQNLDLLEDAEAQLEALEQTDSIVFTDLGRSLSLDDEIYINSYIRITGAEHMDLDKDAGMLLWNRPVTEAEAVFGQEDVRKTGLIPTGTPQEYGQQTPGIAAKEYNDPLYLRFYVQSPSGAFAYSPLTSFNVRSYGLAVLQGRNPRLRDAALQLLHFGAAAQVYFDYHTDCPANADIPASRPWSEDLLTPTAPFSTELQATGDVKVLGKSLSLDDVVGVNFYFASPDFSVASAQLLVWTDLSQPLTEANARLLPMTLSQGTYGVRAMSFAARAYEQTVCVCARFTEPTGQAHYSAVIPFSVESVAGDAIHSDRTSDSMKAVARQLVLYGEAARAYFGV